MADEPGQRAEDDTVRFDGDEMEQGHRSTKTQLVSDDALPEDREIQHRPDTTATKIMSHRPGFA